MVGYHLTLNQRVPGSSPDALPKPRQPSSIGNRPFLRGFSTVSFRVLGLCGHSRSLEAIFCARSLHPEIPFPAAREGRRERLNLARDPAFEAHGFAALRSRSSLISGGGAAGWATAFRAT